MYHSPNAKNLNHKKGVYADGIAKNPKQGSPNSAAPDWLQPLGIFVNGTFFNPKKLLLAVCNLYKRITDHTLCNGPEVPLESASSEDESFSAMLAEQTKAINEHLYFLLYNLDFISGSSCEPLVSTFEG